MSEQKHTQGKWVVGECHQVLTQDGRTVADAGCSTFPKEEQEANARLIAAAPELYDALLSMIRYLGSIRAYISECNHSISLNVQQVEFLLGKATSAIKKVRGEQEEAKMEN